MAEKKETRAMLETKAQVLFDSNKDIDVLYLCANGQGFTDEKCAVRYAKQFTDDNVYTFEREKAGADNLTEGTTELVNSDKALDYDDIHKELLEDRAFLMARYKALSGNDAPKNIKDETLVSRVQELEVERFGNTEKE